MLPIGPLLAAGVSLVGGKMANNATADANAIAAAQAAAANRRARKDFRTNINLQKQFAKESIQWKVHDAKRAGIHPLYALGAGTSSYSPVSVGTSSYSPIPEVGMANALSSAGQDISRAVTSVQTAGEREYVDTVRALELQRMGLSNELLKSQIARERTLSMPAIPDTGSLWAAPLAQGKPSPVQPLQFGGLKWETSPNTSNAQDVENRYGDEGPLAYFAGVPALLDDLYRNSLLGRWYYNKYPFNH